MNFFQQKVANPFKSMGGSYLFALVPHCLQLVRLHPQSHRYQQVVALLWCSSEFVSHFPSKGPDNPVGPLKVLGT